MSSSSVWVQLYYEGENEPKSNPIDIERSDIPNGRISGLARRLKEIDMKNDLHHCDRGSLEVYPPDTERPFSEDKAIDPGDNVPDGTTSKNPLIVAAPDPKKLWLHQLQQQQQGGGTYTLGSLATTRGEVDDMAQQEQMRLQVQQLNLLKLVAEEVNKTRKSRLNCWERESARTTGSKRNPKFRSKVIKYYQRESPSGKSVKCQILDQYVTHAVAQNTIIAAHIWKASTRGKDLEEFGLREEDVNNTRNGLFLTKGIEDAFDDQRVCFLYNTLNKQLFLWVADSRILSETIEGSDPPKKFSDVHQRPLCCPDECHLPFRRLLSWHARLTLELRKENVQASNFTSEYDLSPGRESVTLDPISRAIDDMVEPGEDASVSRE